MRARRARKVDPTAGARELAGAERAQALQRLDAIEESQRREYVRARVGRPVVVGLEGDRGEVETRCIDVSGAGILLVGPDIAQIGDRVDLRIVIDDASNPVIASGRVVRATPRGQRAVAFDSISKGDQRRLIRFVFERLRIDRARGLKLEERDRR